MDTFKKRFNPQNYPKTLTTFKITVGNTLTSHSAWKLLSVDPRVFQLNSVTSPLIRDFFP